MFYFSVNDGYYKPAICYNECTRLIQSKFMFSADLTPDVRTIKLVTANQGEVLKKSKFPRVPIKRYQLENIKILSTISMDIGISGKFRNQLGSNGFLWNFKTDLTKTGYHTIIREIEVTFLNIPTFKNAFYDISFTFKSNKRKFE